MEQVLKNTNNVVDIFDGFYLTDRDADGSATGVYWNSRNLWGPLGLGGIVEAGVEGGLFANIGFNYGTVTEEFPDGDGRFGGEIQERLAMGLCV